MGIGGLNMGMEIFLAIGHPPYSKDYRVKEILLNLVDKFSI